MRTETQLETKYRPVLACTEAKQVIKMDSLTAGKIRGAITRFQRECGFDRPRNFTDQEIFAFEMVDWWQDENPEIFETERAEAVEEAVNKYLAHVSTWKSKIKDGTILVGDIALAAGATLTIKNAACGGIKAICSMAKRRPEIDATSVCDGLKFGFTALLPVIHNLQSGKFDLPPGTEIDDITRLIGAYLAGDQAVIDTANSLKLIDACETSAH